MWQAISYYAALALESLIGVFGIRLYEEPRYDVIDRLADRVEIRRYAPCSQLKLNCHSPARLGAAKPSGCCLLISRTPTAHQRRGTTGSP